MEPSKELVDDIYRERVLRARRTPPEEKLLDGARLFDLSCRIMMVADLHFTMELFHLSEDPHDQERFRRRRRVKLFNREVSLPTVEDVLVTKLGWCLQGQRSKDWDDVRNVIAIQGDRIDWNYV